MRRPGRQKGRNDNEPTPQLFYNNLNNEFMFDFDPCPPNHTFDGLSVEWGKRNYCNPPYSTKILWIAKAIKEQKKGRMTVMLLPVDTSPSWFQDSVFTHADICWVRGRLKLDNGKHPMYASMLAVFHRPDISLSEYIIYRRSLAKFGVMTPCYFNLGFKVRF